MTEYQVVAKMCPACGETTTGVVPPGVASLAQYGPVVHAKAALAVCAHYLPVARAAGLVAAYTGVQTRTCPMRCTPGAARTGCAT